MNIKIINVRTLFTEKNVEFPLISFECGAGGVFCSPTMESCQGHQRCYVKMIRGGRLKYFGQLFDAN